MDVRLTGDLNQDVIDGLSHFEIFTATSGYRPGSTFDHRPGTLFSYPHGFHWPQTYKGVDSGTTKTRSCYDIEIKAIAEPGSGWVDSPTFKTWVSFYFDYSHGIFNPPSQPRIASAAISRRTNPLTGPWCEGLVGDKGATPIRFVQTFEEPTQ